MPALKYLDPVSGTYKTLVGIQGPTGPAGLADPADAASGVFGEAPLDFYGADPLIGNEVYVDSAGKLRARPELVPSANGLNITDSPALYPPGMSIMGMGQVDALAKGWPASGTVVTYRRAKGADQVVHQYFYQNHTPQLGAPFMQFRTGNAANNPMWSSWITQYGTSSEKNYACQRSTVATQSVPTGAFTNIVYESLGYEDGIAWSTTNNNFLVPVDGYYEVNAVVTFNASNTTGVRTAAIYVNSASVFTAANSPSASNITSVPISGTLKCVAGDYITIRAFHTAGVAVTLNATVGYNRVTITKVPAPLPAGAQFGEQTYFASRGHGAALSIPSAVTTIVPFDTSVADDGITWNGTAFVAPVTGYYNVEGSLTYNWVNTTGSRFAMVYVNGAQVWSAASAPPAGGVSSCQISITVRANAGETIDVRAYQTAGVAVTLSANAIYTRVSVTKVPAPVVGGNAASGVWGTGNLDKTGSEPNFGDLIYVDSRGQLRAQPQALSTSVYPKTAAMLPGTYPIGMTIVQMTGAQATSGGWPEGASGSVVTFRRSGELDADAVASQWYYITTSATPRAYYRSGSGTGGANKWSSWVFAIPDDTGWVEAESLFGDANWSNYNISGATYTTAQYRRVGNKVTLRGLVKTAIARTGVATILTLPAGVRPLASDIYNGTANCQLVTGAASTGTAHTHSATYGLPIRVDVTAAGVVSVSAAGGLSLPAGAYLSLAQVEFYTD